MPLNSVHRLTGWGLGLMAFLVYALCLAPSASFWDCGEFIAAAHWLQVSHPPGAPLYALLGRLLSLGAAPDAIAWRINLLSAMASGGTIALLYWSFIRIVRFLPSAVPKPEPTPRWMLQTAGVIGTLCFAFSDSHWFSSVEAEVYALSLFFTALTFWAGLRSLDAANGARWWMLTVFLIGLSLGIHQLNLLVIPPLVLIGWLKKHRARGWKWWLVLAGSGVLLLVIQDVLIPGCLRILAQWELFAVNKWHWSFDHPTLLALTCITLVLMLFLWVSHHRRWWLGHQLALAFTLLAIGCSSYVMISLRSGGNPWMDEGNPENMLAFERYFNREQYGKAPLWYGAHFNTPQDPEVPFLNGDTVFYQNQTTGRYEVADKGIQAVPNYLSQFQMVFPRMHGKSSVFRNSYREFSGFRGDTGSYAINDQRKTVVSPTQGENLQFFLNYQLGWMYARFFAWNFIGRQNDIQGHGGILFGNWLSGIPWLDELHLGTGDRSGNRHPNPGNNRYFALPFLLGVLGFLVHFRQGSPTFWPLLWLFLFTGAAVVVFLNQTPLQPRERDYAFVGSFYAFSFWIGIGALAILQKLRKGRLHKMAAVFLLALPGWMLWQGWDDHNRSGETMARDMAYNLLNSCAPNAILFTIGDNDTFPLWYLQQVEAIRTDVRVVNLSLLNLDWYIDQLKGRQGASAPLPIRLPTASYRNGTRDYLYLLDSESPAHQTLATCLQAATSDSLKDELENGHSVYYFPTSHLSLSVPDKRTGDTVFQWTLPQRILFKKDLLLLHILSENRWERPIYFSSFSGKGAHLGLTPFLQSEGMVDRLVPFRSTTGKTAVDKDALRDNLLTRFLWGGMERVDTVILPTTQIPEMIQNGDVFRFQLDHWNQSNSARAQSSICLLNDPPYMNETGRRFAQKMLSTFYQAAVAQLKAKDTLSATHLLHRSWEVIPIESVPEVKWRMAIAEAYLLAQNMKAAEEVMEWIAQQRIRDLEYLNARPPKFQQLLFPQISEAVEDLERLQVHFQKHFANSTVLATIETNLPKWKTQLGLPKDQR
ncbi:MAG: DUF2723 domain-containing protein [Salibacteraceae bacterium]